MKSLKGSFITLEGCEGSGKSTLMTQLAEYLTGRGYSVVKTREPGGTPFGEKIRHLLLDGGHAFNICSQAELLLFLSDRSQHIEEMIKPALKQGQIVLCDRFNDSTIAYQGAARGMDVEFVQKLCRLVCGSIEPQLTLFLDVDPQIGLMRTHRLAKEHAATGQFDRIESEKIDFHLRVQEEFRRLADREPQRIQRIDANQAQKVVLEAAIRMVEELILLPAKKGGA